MKRGAWGGCVMGCLWGSFGYFTSAAVGPDGEEGAKVFLDGSWSVFQALEGLEHNGYLATDGHGPYPFALAFFGYRHDYVKPKKFIKFNGGPDVFDEYIRGEGVHFFRFRHDQDATVGR
jgi:hypothetical protein